MDPNNNPSNTQNSSNYPFTNPNPNNYPFQNQSSNKPQNIPNYGFSSNFFMPSAIPNYHPYYSSMMPHSSQPPPYSSTPLGNEIVLNVGTIEFPEFFTQMTLGGMSGINEVITSANDSNPALRKNLKWNTEQNSVLLSEWIKYETDNIIGRNQKSEAFWGKIAEFCNEHCKFDPPRSGVSCRNHYNYVNGKLAKWVGAYENARRMQQSGWSEQDVLAKAHELYSSGGSKNFNFMKEWNTVRDQPKYGSQVGRNTGSGSSGSKRAHESDASDSNSVRSSARPIGRDASKKKTKKKGKGEALAAVEKDMNEFRQIKEREFERLDKIVKMQEETNRLMNEKTQAKKMKMYLRLNEKKDLDDRRKLLLEKLDHDDRRKLLLEKLDHDLFD